MKKERDLAIDELNSKLKQFSVLSRIIKAIHSTLDLDKMLKIILKCVTTGFALGFNRSFLFLINEADKKLYGKIAVGPTSIDEAYKIWNELSSKNITLEDIILKVDDFYPDENDLKLSNIIQNININLDSDNSIFTKVFKDKKSFLVDNTFTNIIIKYR